MKQTTPVVRCVFNEEGEELEKILDESFRLYINHILAEGAPDGVLY